MSLDDLLPLLTLFISFFIFHQFNWTEATNLILAVLVSMITFGLMIGNFYMDHPRMNLRKLYIWIAVLCVLFILIYFHGYLHWNRMVSIEIRMTIFFVLTVLYVIALFRAIHVLRNLKEKSNRNDGRKK